MGFEHYIRSGTRLLRCGFTTGTCAALAAAGAAELLLTGRAPAVVSLMTPKGWPVELEPVFCRMEGREACCAIRKDAGDAGGYQGSQRVKDLESAHYLRKLHLG